MAKLICFWFLGPSTLGNIVEEVTHPCNPNPCPANELCEVNRKGCPSGDPCLPYSCVQGKRGSGYGCGMSMDVLLAFIGIIFGMRLQGTLFSQLCFSIMFQVFPINMYYLCKQKRRKTNVNFSSHLDYKLNVFRMHSSHQFIKYKSFTFCLKHLGVFLRLKK